MKLGDAQNASLGNTVSNAVPKNKRFNGSLLEFDCVLAHRLTPIPAWHEFQLVFCATHLAGEPFRRPEWRQHESLHSRKCLFVIQRTVFTSRPVRATLFFSVHRETSYSLLARCFRGQTAASEHRQSWRAIFSTNRVRLVGWFAS